jgi:hypothetical protein
VEAVPLQHPAPNAELSLATDASGTHIRGVMQQKSGDHWRPLGFFSRKLTDTESRYSTFDRELLAAHAAIKRFRHFLSKVELFNFVQITNHLSLPFLVFQPPFHPDNSAIWHSFQSLLCKCCICPVLKNVVADFLSCPNQATTGSVAAAKAANPLDFKEMAAEQTVAQKRSVCWAAHPLNWFSTRQALSAWLEMFQQAIFTQLFPSNSEKTFLIIFTMLL